MYSNNQTQSLQTFTKQLLALPLNANATIEQVEQLKELLQFHEYRYYVLNEPFIADYEYDQLYQQLRQIEAAHPNWITVDSPTQRVGNSLNQSCLLYTSPSPRD